MEKLFLAVLNLSIMASYLILAVIAARWLLRKMPKSIICYLWLLVGVRLICPFSIESTFSLLPKEVVFDDGTINDIHTGEKNQESFNTDEIVLYGSKQDTLNQDSTNQDSLNQNSMEQGNDKQDNVNQNSTNQDNINSNDFLQDANNKLLFAKIYHIAVFIWLAGMGIMFLYFVISWQRVRRQVCMAIPMELEGIKYYQCDSISSPFLFGVMKPRIYIPSRIVQEERIYILQHEAAHRQRRDYLVKPISYLLLMVYWINPLIWAAYILLCRDIELACDEQVVKEMGTDCKKMYSQVLLTYSESHNTIAACPVAFGEIGVKQRVKNIINYRKPTIWVILTAAVVGIVIMICFMTKPKLSNLADKNMDISENTNFDNSGKNADTTEKTDNNTLNPIITEQVDIQASKIFHLSIPRELVDLLSFETPSDFELSIKSKDKQDMIGTMCVMRMDDIKNVLSEDEYYLIGTYGANSLLVSHATAENLLMPITGDNVPDGIIRQEGLDLEVPEGIIRPDESEEIESEKGGIQPIPNADGTHKPENLPNSEGGFTAGVIGEINRGSDNNTNKDADHFSDSFCYIFIPAKQTTWQTENVEKLQELQNKVISLLDSVTITEVEPLTEYRNITIDVLTVSSRLKEDAELLENYFPDHHEIQNELVQTVDLDGDGIDEEITMTNLMYNGGDGGYVISVKRNGTEIPMPQIYNETFPYYVKYDTSEALDGEDVVLKIYVGDNTICALTADALYELYLQKGEIDGYKQYMANKDQKQTQNEIGSIIYTIDANEEINGDAVSGFTVQTIDGKPVLILKTYLSGLLGHADTLGYAITYMTLHENDIWEVSHRFLLEGV